MTTFRITENTKANMAFSPEEACKDFAATTKIRFETIAMKKGAEIKGDIKGDFVQFRYSNSTDCLVWQVDKKHTEPAEEAPVVKEQAPTKPVIVNLNYVLAGLGALAGLLEAKREGKSTAGIVGYTLIGGFAGYGVACASGVTLMKWGKKIVQKVQKQT